MILGYPPWCQIIPNNSNFNTQITNQTAKGHQLQPFPHCTGLRYIPISQDSSIPSQLLKIIDARKNSLQELRP